MKRQLLSLSVLLTVSLSVALNDAIHARNGVSSALKPFNTHRPVPKDESVFYGVVGQETRSLADIHVTIHLYDFCDCPDGPKCPHHLYECPHGKYCEEPYKCDGDLYDQDYGVEDSDSDDSDSDDSDSDEDSDETGEVHLVPCNEVDGNEDLSLTRVKWSFFVETNREDPTNVVDKVCGAMGTAVLDAAFDDEECSFESHRRRRRLEIKGYSEEVTCTHYEDCMPTDEDSKSCGVYEATVVVAFDDEGEDNTSASQVSSTVTGAAEDSFANDDIKNTVNEQLDDTGEAATVVGYGNPNGNEEVGAGLDGEIFRDTESGNRLTRAGKAAIAAMAALIVLLLLICCICWRRHRNRSDEEKSVGSGNTELSPSRGLFGGGSRSGGSQSDDDMTYMASDFNNLGMCNSMYHSKLDVHACSSASCDQCNPIMREQSAGVYFVGSKGGSPLSDIVEEECKSSSEYKSEQIEEDDFGNDAIPPPPSRPPPPEDTGAKEKKSFFSRFRRSKAQPTQAPNVQSFRGGEGGDEQIEIEI